MPDSFRSFFISFIFPKLSDVGSTFICLQSLFIALKYVSPTLALNVSNGFNFKVVVTFMLKGFIKSDIICIAFNLLYCLLSEILQSIKSIALLLPDIERGFLTSVIPKSKLSKYPVRKGFPSFRIVIKSLFVISTSSPLKIVIAKLFVKLF